MPEAPTKRVNGKSQPEPRPPALKKAGNKDLEKNNCRVKFVEKPKDLKKQTVVSKGTKFEKKKVSKAEEQLQQAAAAAAKKSKQKEKAVEVTQEKSKKKEKEDPPLKFVPCKRAAVEGMFKTPPSKTKRNVSPSVKSSSSASKKETVKAKVQELLNQLEQSADEASSSTGEEVEDENDVEEKEESDASQDEEEEEEEAGEGEDEQDEEEEGEPSEAEASEDDEEAGEGEDCEEETKEVKAEEKQAQLASAVEASEAKTANLRNSYTSGLATISCKGSPVYLLGCFGLKLILLGLIWFGWVWAT